MKAGALRHRVTLERRVDVQDGDTGATTPTWVPLGTWRCEIKPLSVREALVDGGVRDEADCKLVGRRNQVVSTLQARDRAVGTDDRIYNLAGVPQFSNGNDEAILRAKSGLNDG